MVLLTHPAINNYTFIKLQIRFGCYPMFTLVFGSDLADQLPRQLSGSLWVSKCKSSELFWLFAVSHRRAANQVLIITYEQLFTLARVLTSKTEWNVKWAAFTKRSLLIHKHTTVSRRLFCTAEWIYWLYFLSLVVRKQSVCSTRKNIWTFGKCS